MKKIADRSNSNQKPKKEKVIKEKKKQAFIKDQKCGRCGFEVAKKWFAKHWRTSHRVQRAKQHKVLAEG